MKFKKGPSTDASSKYKTLRITYSTNKLNCLWSPLYFILWALLIGLVYWIITFLPKPLDIKDESNNPNEFIAERAEGHLKSLVSIGPRPFGSANNEQVAVQRILDSIKKIRTLASKNHRIVIDRQLDSHISFPFIYKNVQNVIVKLTSINSTSNSSLLINSHFDSVRVSPGASDDAAMVAVSLEVLRILAQNNETFKHSIIFLFNGAEESGLLGSRLFLNKHRWAKDVKVVINLDAVGNGGREILFQTGPNHPWLVNLYSNVAKHPYGTVIAEEIFQNNLISSQTDYSVFVKHGIPGLDLAYHENSYVYHTSHDRIQSNIKETLQNTGDNILAIAKELANSNELENPSEHERTNSVFFDYLGLFFINYCNTTALIINITICIIAVIVIIISLYIMKKNSGLFCKRIFIKLLVIFLIQFASICLGLGLSLLMGWFLDEIGYSMVWYANNWFIFGLYFCTIFFGLSLLPLIYIKLTEENEFFPHSYKIQMFLHSHCLILVIILLIATICNIRSAYMIMIPVVFYTISIIINLIIRLQEKSISWIIFPILSQIIPFIYYIYIIFLLIGYFIAQLGRSGADYNPEIMIAILCFIFAIPVCGFLIPILFIFRKSEILVTLFALISLIFVILAITPIGFPYNESRFQRFNVVHAKRTFHNEYNQTIITESGYYVTPKDRRSVNTIKDIVHNMTLGMATESCDPRDNCGFPVSTVWVPAGPPDLIRYPILKTLEKKILGRNETTNLIRYRYNYTLTGPNSMVISVKRYPACYLFNTSLPESLEKKDFEVFYQYGISNEHTEQFNFWLEFEKMAENFDDLCFEIAITGNLNNHQIYRTDEFRKFLNSFPKWTDVDAWLGSYESFKIK